MRYSCVAAFPRVRLTAQSKVVSVTSKAVSQTFVNSEGERSGTSFEGKNVGWDITVNNIRNDSKICTVVEECNQTLVFAKHVVQDGPRRDHCACRRRYV